MMQLPDDVMKETNELLAQLVKEFEIPLFDPKTEVTAMTLAEAAGINESTARRRLAEGFKAGEYTKRIVKLPDGNKSTAYSKK
jgi:response regulator of citrate/malate metabolism